MPKQEKLHQLLFFYFNFRKNTSCKTTATNSSAPPRKCEEC